MKRTLGVILLGLIVLSPVTSASGLKPLGAKVNLSDRASLQRGATLYVNYCLSCHAASFMRYNRLAKDLGISDEQVMESMLFAGDKIEDPMQVAMRAESAEKWFGVAPPDLSVIARSRGADWLYSYLVTFYADDNPARPLGVNNVMFSDVGMPHVTWEMQGRQVYVAGEMPAPESVESVRPDRLEASGDSIKIVKKVLTKDGAHHTVIDRLELTDPGLMAAGEYRKSMRDLVNFLAYLGEPAQLVRGKIGFWVLAFLGLFFFLTRALKNEYWKDVH